MDAGKAVLLDNPLGDQDRVLKIIAVPGHEGDAQILAQGQFTHIRSGAVRKPIAPLDDIPRPYQWTLVYAGVLIGTGVLD
jgi:hypothetical protein